jgi:hypothetical protein
MNQSFTGGDDGALLRLWQETTIATPDSDRMARSVGRMALERFDRAIVHHDFREYAAFVLLAVVFSGQAAMGGDRVQAAIGIASGVFVVSYLWWQHRRLTGLDPTADGRAYQAALLERIDGQLRLLKNIRYWYLLPLYLPVMWTVVVTWRRHPVGAVVGWALMTAVYVVIGWLCERMAVRRLTVEREAVASLYAESER